MLSLQLGPRQPLVRDMPGSVWGSLRGVQGSQMTRPTGLGSGETHSCLGSCLGWRSHRMLHEHGGKLMLGQLPCLWANWQEQQPLLLEEEKRSEQGPNQGNEAQTACSQTFHTALFWKRLLLGHPTTEAAAWTSGNTAHGQGQGQPAAMARGEAAPGCREARPGQTPRRVVLRSFSKQTA